MISDFARQASENDEWPEPVPFDQYSSLPDFPVDALSGIGREIVEIVSEVNQVDAALPACFYLGALSACLAKKARVDLVSHKEPLNLYLCPIAESGERKTATCEIMTGPAYECQKARQDEMDAVIRDAQVHFKVREKRLEKLQKKAAEDEDSKKREQAKNEALEAAREMDEHPIPVKPDFLVDDVTPEKLGALMAENGERMAVLTCEGGLFEIMAGRYSRDGAGNLDLFLKAHAGDYWGNHRIGREKKTMEAPALTLCLAVQSDVIEEVGRTPHFRGKGLLARFLYAKCESQVGYRERQTTGIPLSLRENYRRHVFSLMDIPFTNAALRLSQDGQALWDDFYNDAEREMRPGGSLYYLRDWGSKLPGAVGRIAGLLHLAEHGAAGLSLPISVDIVSASCGIGAYFKEHAIAVFGMMQEDPRMKLARQILEYVERERPDTFTVRDIMRHTSIGIRENVDLGVKVLVDRGYIRAEEPVKADGPGRPKAAAYRVNPVFLRDKNV